MNIKEIREEVKKAMESGKYPVASIKMFETIHNLELTMEAHKLLLWTQELLIEHLQELYKLKEQNPDLEAYLRTAKVGDIIDNQSLEKENSFLIGLYFQISSENAIDRLIKYYIEKKEFTKEDLKNLALLLIRGTSSEKKKVIRDGNEKFVGRFVNGERIIDYFPIDYQKTDEAASKLAEFYNSRLIGTAYDNLLVQPFVLHGLVGALQIFGDGNTRIGRLLQHSLIWQLINEKTEFEFSSPPIYATRTYYPMRGEYRTHIANLVKYNNNEVWNEWISFNLIRIQDAIYRSNENILELKRRKF